MLLITIIILIRICTCHKQYAHSAGNKHIPQAIDTSHNTQAIYTPPPQAIETSHKQYEHSAGNNKKYYRNNNINNVNNTYINYNKYILYL